MNEINFEIQDIERIDLSMDVGVKEIYPPIENLEVTPSKEQQIFNHENSYGYDKVTVEAITLQAKEVTPTTTEQNIVADSGYSGLHQVTVGAVTNEIDSNIISENIKNGINILGVEGNFIGGKYAPKYISFYYSTQTNMDNDINGLDTSNITNMSHMFEYCQAQNLDLTTFDTSNVTNMQNMFAFSYVKTVNLTSFDVSKVTNMRQMFRGVQNLSELDLSTWTTDSLTDMYNMFYQCTKLTSIDISNFNTSKVTTMASLYYYCTSMTSANISNINGLVLTNMSSLFQECNKLETVIANNCNVSKVTTMASMFSSCIKIQRLDLSSFVTTSLTNMNNMFYNCTSLEYLDIRNFDFTNVTSYANTFYKVPANCEIIVKDDTAKTWVLARRSDFTNVKILAEL